MGKIVFIRLNFIFFYSAQILLISLLFQKETKKKLKKIKGIVYGLCKTNDKEIRQSKNGSFHKIHVTWLYYGDIKIRDTFVCNHILRCDMAGEGTALIGELGF